MDVVRWDFTQWPVLKNSNYTLYNLNSKITSDDDIYGHIYNNKIRILVNNTFKTSHSILNYENMIENDIIGFLVYLNIDEIPTMAIKLAYNTKMKPKTNHNDIRGFYCHQSNDKTKIIKIYKNLLSQLNDNGKKLYKDSTSKLSTLKKNNLVLYCKEIINLLKINQFTDIKKRIWIYEYV